MTEAGDPGAPAPAPATEVDVDVDGRVTGDAPDAGRPLAARFDPQHAGAIARAIRHGWALLADRPWRLAGGGAVRITASPRAGGGARLQLVDRTVECWLEELRAREHRRVRDAEIALELAREFADPLSVVLGRLELLAALGSADADTLRHVGVASDHARRVSAALRNLRMVGRAPHGAPGAGRLRDALAEALDLLGPLRDRVLVTLDPADLEVAAQPPVLGRILGTLARRSLDSTGRSAIHARAWRERTTVRIDVGPSGRPQGAPEAVDGQFGFEAALLAAIGGSAAARSTANGTRFEVTVPHPARTRARPRPLRDRVLVVGPAELAEVVAAGLANDGVAVSHAPGPDEALDLDPEALQHVVCDALLTGPGGDGVSGVALRRILAPRIAGRFLLIADRVDGAPADLLPVLLARPLGRVALLEALRGRSPDRDPASDGAADALLAGDPDSDGVDDPTRPRD